MAIDAALEDVKSGRTIPVPEHLRDANYKGAERLGHGKGYKYAHDHPGHFVAQDYLGADKIYYEPTEQGVEKKIKERLENWREAICLKPRKKSLTHGLSTRIKSRPCARKSARALEKISPAVRAVESIELCDRLEAQLPSARTILFFAPLPDELDVWPLLEKFLAAGQELRPALFRFRHEKYLRRGGFKI